MAWRDGRRVSLIFPTYNERDSIRVAILDALETGLLDEVIVVNNNAAPGTSEQVAEAASQAPAIVREVHEPRQGYGAAIRRGLSEATGDYIVVSEPDGTFLARDVFKLLAYVEDFDVVYGSRTSNILIWHGANMGVFLRWGNWAVAKLMELLFNTTTLTDVGCTLRVMRRSALERISPLFTIAGSAFGPEMMLLTFASDLRVIQVPVNYLPRVGASSVTGDPFKATTLGLWMIGLIVNFRVRSWFDRRPVASPSVPTTEHISQARAERSLVGRPR